MRAKRDYAMLAMLFGWRFSQIGTRGIGVGRNPVASGALGSKGGHICTVPIPNWAKAALDNWTRAANVTEGKVFRAVARRGKTWGRGMSQNVVWYVVRSCCQRAGLDHIVPHDLLLRT